MQALQPGNGLIAKSVLSENYTLCMLEGARSGRSPQMSISSMPSPVKEKNLQKQRAKNPTEILF
jgi:hypothetical protein